MIIKKLFLTIFSIVFILSLACFTSCDISFFDKDEEDGSSTATNHTDENKEEGSSFVVGHTHVYDQKVENNAFLDTAGTCITPATYFYSCSCSKAGSNYFVSKKYGNHNYSADWRFDAEGHWHYCARCNTTNTKIAHSFSGNICTDCGYEVPDAQGLAFLLLDDGNYGVAVGNARQLSKIEIPAYHNGKPVTTIVDDGFYGKATEIIIPDTVTTIGEGAFMNYTTLTSINIPDSVTTIGDNAFYNCDSLTFNIYQGGKYLGSDRHPYKVLIKGSATSGIHDDTIYIEHGAFDNCAELTSVVIPKSVVNISKNAFLNCANLSSIQYLGDMAGWCKNASGFAINIGSLRSLSVGGVLVEGNVTIPEGVTNIGRGAFNGCTGLISIELPNSVKTIGGDAFNGCTSLASISIPDSVTSIENYAFEGCTNLASVTIGKGLTSIGFGAFNGCTSLASISIPDGVTSIGASAFEYCAGLTSIVIPNSVLTIGDSAFNGCTNLASVTIGNGVTSIGNNAFYGCTKLAGVLNESSLAIAPGSTDYGYIGYYAELVITTVNGFKFKEDGTNSTLMEYTGNLKDLILPSTSPTGKNYAISGYALESTGLTSVTIPGSVTSIGNYAFRACTVLTSVTIGNGVTSIGDLAFYGCQNLTTITYNGTKAQWNLIEKGSGWNRYYDSVFLTEKTIPLTVTCTDGDVNY